MRIILLVTVLLNASTAYSQLDLRKKVAIHVDNSRLEDVLAWLQEYHEMKLSYGFDNVSRETRITIHSESISLYEIVHAICKQGNLIFQVIDSTIVFKYQKPYSRPLTEPDRYLKDVLDRNQHRNVVSDSVLLDSLQESKIVFEQPIRSDHDSLAMVIDSPGSNFLVSKDEEIRSIEIRSVSSTSERLRRRLAVQTGVFINYAIDYNQFQFADRDISVQKYKAEHNESYSLGAYILLSKKLYMSLGVAYVSKNFHLNYHYKVVDLNDPFPIPHKTHVYLRYLEVPFTAGYSLKTWRKYSALVSTGINPSFLLKEKEYTTYQNQGNPNTQYFLKDTQSTLLSASIGFILHRYVNRFCGVFIEPGYLYFLEAVNKQAMDSRSTLFRIKGGIQFALSANR